MLGLSAQSLSESALTFGAAERRYTGASDIKVADGLWPQAGGKPSSALLVHSVFKCFAGGELDGL